MKFFEVKKNSFFPQKEGDLIFEALEQDFFEKNHGNFIFSEKKVYFLKDNFIQFQKIGSNIKEILKRLLKKEYDRNFSFFSEKYQTKISEDEIFKINSIILEAQKFFDLRTALEGKFKIIENKEVKTFFEVNYDQKEAFLEIKPMIDYRIEKFNIGQSVYRANSKGESFFIRRFNHQFGLKYIFKKNNYQIDFAKIDSEKEIEFFKEIFSFHRELGFSKALTLKKQGQRQIASFINNH
jgi:hypothetical protein